MSRNRIVRTIVPAAAMLACLMLLAGQAFATQQHGDPEGLYSHQIAHLFFIASMVVLIVQIALAHQWRSRRNGWHYIGISAALFIAWNLDTVAVHMLDEYVTSAMYSGSGYWGRSFEITETWAKFAYAGKILDHALLVSAVLAFVHALRLFSAEPQDGPRQ